MPDTQQKKLEEILRNRKKLTDLSEEAMNRILHHLPAANRVRLAAVSKDMHKHVNRVQHGPMSPHPSHNTLREPDTNLVTRVAQRFTELRDFLRACVAHGPINVIEPNSDHDYFEEMDAVDRNGRIQFAARRAERAGRFAERQKRRNDRYAWFTEFWETHSKVPGEDAHLRRYLKRNDWGDDTTAGCTIRVNCGPTYHFTLDIVWDNRDKLYLRNFYFENHDGILHLVSNYLDASFETNFVEQVSYPTIYISNKTVRKCAQLAVVFRKVVSLLYPNNPLRRIQVDNYHDLESIYAGWDGDLRKPLMKILQHNGFDATLSGW